MGGHIRVPENIDVYVRPDCPECDQTIHYLEHRGLHFRVHDVEREADALEDLNALGYSETDAPVTFLDETVVAGFDADRLDACLVGITM